MSKFNEICESFKISRKQYFDYRDECWKFANQLINGFREYAKIPNEQFTFVPLDKEINSDSLYSLMAVMVLQDDTYWHFGFQITLYEAPNIYPYQPILFKITLKKSNGKFIVKVGPNFEKAISLDSEAEKIELYEYLCNSAVNCFKGSLEKFLENKAITKRIGF